MPPFTLGYRYAAGALAGLLGITSLFVIPIGSGLEADMRLEPRSGTLILSEPFVVNVVAEANTSVNVFQGDISFDASMLRVESIDYNTSLADLWAEEPWYSNGAGTLNFIGGTTRPGGFTGKDTLITITFIPTKTGEATIDFTAARILLHNGLGTDAEIAEPIDGLFSVSESELKQQTVRESTPTSAPSRVEVIETPPRTDLNGDGKQTIADTSIFMSDLISQNKRSDFNRDGTVSVADMSILLNAQ